MIIGIDASRALKPLRTGTEVHNAEIIKHIAAIDQRDTLRLYSSHKPFGDMTELEQKNLEWRIMPFSRGWTLFRLSWEMLVHPPDVLFVPAHILPIISPKKSVVMIHDIGFDHFRELYKWIQVWYHRYAIWYAKWFASHILTPSEYTRQDLHRVYKIPLAKMTVVHHGFNPDEFRHALKSEQSPNTTPYFYFVGRNEHKKNLVRMLEAFVLFKQQTKLPHQFVIAGSPGYGYATIQRTYNGLPKAIKADVHFLGYISQKESTRLLRHAQALLFVTLFEGFGFPALEAFASGTPVITSNTTSMPEVVGDAALTVDPTSTEQIANAMIQVATDETLRHNLITKGNEQYQKFSWERAAKETLALLEKVVSHA